MEDTYFEYFEGPFLGRLIPTSSLLSYDGKTRTYPFNRRFKYHPYNVKPLDCTLEDILTYYTTVDNIRVFTLWEYCVIAELPQVVEYMLNTRSTYVIKQLNDATHFELREIFNFLTPVLFDKVCNLSSVRVLENFYRFLLFDPNNVKIKEFVKHWRFTKEDIENIIRNAHPYISTILELLDSGVEYTDVIDKYISK